LVFKRRDRRPIWKIALDFVYPKGGWTRAFHYVKHRLNRLPGSPERIARGMAAGVFTAFTPFYGLHFIIAALLARLMQGNILAALLGTFAGNPLTYVPIGAVAMKSGYFLLGFGTGGVEEDVHRSLGGKFVDAGTSLVGNIRALYLGRPADWHGLSVFYNEVFFPYLVGGIIPGLAAAVASYYVAVPIIRAYQKRRAKKIMAKIEARRKTARRVPDTGPGNGPATRGE
jgi:uncharacterized protein (DUF2062 family)